MRTVLGVSSCLGLLLGACGGGAANGDDGEPDAAFSCATEDRGETFSAGMQKTGDKGVVFTLISSDPAPPARDNNTWLIGLADDSGPLVGATLSVKPFMPDHNHGTSIPTNITAGDNPGEYQANPVNLFMPGVWEITVNATPAGGGAADKDSVVFTFCIDS
jgi:hypothetical protein